MTFATLQTADESWHVMGIRARRVPLLAQASAPPVYRWGAPLDRSTLGKSLAEPEVAHQLDRLASATQPIPQPG